MHNIILIHGLWHNKLWLMPMNAKLRKLGFKTQSFSYSTVRVPLNLAISNLAQQIKNLNSEVILVGHSLGGLIALEALRINPKLPISHIVCLGSPINGSLAAKNLAKYKLGACLLGVSKQLLCAKEKSWLLPIPVGMLAGDYSKSAANFLMPLIGTIESPNDGTVSVKETYCPKLTDHYLIHTNHLGLLTNNEVAMQIKHFVAHHQFKR